MRVTIKHIAEKLDLSVSTVSRSLSKVDDQFISDSTRALVRSMAKEMGYTPNRAARALVTGRTNLVELQLPTSDQFCSQISSVIIEILRNSGYDTIVHDLTRGKWNEQNAPDSRQLWPADGIISMANESMLEAFLGSCSANLVSIGANFTRRVDYVGLDLYPGTLDAVRHLVKTGCKRIAYLLDRKTDYSNEVRGIAYQQAVKEAGLECEFIFVNGNSKRSARDSMKSYIESNGSPDGIFCHNDNRAIGALRALQDMGLKVPEDVKLIGCDGIEDTEFTNPRISTIVTPIEEMCDMAWKFLQNRMEDQTAPKQQAMLYPKFVSRESA